MVEEENRDEVISGLLDAGTRDEARSARAAADRYRQSHPADQGVIAALERLETKEDSLPRNAQHRFFRRRVAYAALLITTAFCLYIYGIAAGIVFLLFVAFIIEAVGWGYALVASRTPNADDETDAED